MPVVPGKNETGTKTAIRTRDVAMTALVTSPMAREVASCGSECSMAMWRCTFSMTTMASSTTRPVASVMPKSVSELMEKPKSLMKAKVPISETGMVTAGMMVARQSSRKRKMTTDDDDRWRCPGSRAPRGSSRPPPWWSRRRWRIQPWRKALGKLGQRGLGLGGPRRGRWRWRVA